LFFVFLKLVGQKRKGINPEFILFPLFSRSVELLFAPAGLLTRSVFDAFPSARWRIVATAEGKQVSFRVKRVQKHFKSLQQRELSGIHTRFPFHPPYGETIRVYTE
jgi:hypothetical protein